MYGISDDHVAAVAHNRHHAAACSTRTRSCADIEFVRLDLEGALRSCQKVLRDQKRCALSMKAFARLIPSASSWKTKPSPISRPRRSMTLIVHPFDCLWVRIRQSRWGMPEVLSKRSNILVSAMV